MTAPSTEAKPTWVRAEIPDSTHRALRVRQNKKENETNIRPQMTEVVAEALTEWANSQPQQ